jgi:hypothetical protein
MHRKVLIATLVAQSFVGFAMAQQQGSGNSQQQGSGNS